MTQHAIFHVDAFATRPFEGNPAAVVPLQAWLPDETLQAIAAQNNLSETAYFVMEDGVFHIRWFTPTTEVDLCGHATLATAFVLQQHLGFQGNVLKFSSRSGLLTVASDGDLLMLDFPADSAKECDIPEPMVRGLDVRPTACLAAMDYLAVLETEEQVRTLQPDLQALSKLDRRGVIVTAPSEQYDFVVRFFAPNAGIEEDPVTGSAYTQLAPYWGAVLQKQTMHARQLSSRGGDVSCTLAGDRVRIAGRARLYMQGLIRI